MKRRGFIGALAALVAAPVAAKIVVAQPERERLLPLVDRDEDDQTMDRCPRCGALAVRRVMFVQSRPAGVSFASESDGYFPSTSGPIITEGCELCAGIIPHLSIPSTLADRRVLREDDYIVFANGPWSEQSIEKVMLQ